MTKCLNARKLLLKIYWTFLTSFKDLEGIPYGVAGKTLCVRAIRKKHRRLIFFLIESGDIGLNNGKSSILTL